MWAEDQVALEKMEEEQMDAAYSQHESIQLPDRSVSFRLSTAVGAKGAVVDPCSL
jgi:hypothetical protein